MNNARCDHLGAGDFLDLARRTGAVIDLDALAQPQIDDVLLPRHLFGAGIGAERKQRKATEQQKRAQLQQLAAAHLSATHGLRNWQAFVRINPLNTPEALHDLAALVGNGVDGIVLPKADGAEDVVRLGSYLDVLETRASLPLGTTRIIVVCTETARAMLNAGSYTRGLPRLVGLTWGAEDLSAALGAISNREADGSLSPIYVFANSMCLCAAASAGVGSPKVRNTKAISLVVCSPYLISTGGCVGLRGLFSELS